MTCANPHVRLAPITTGLLRRNPRILLGGNHQPTLVRYLDGWPKRWQGSRTFLIQFARDLPEIARFADDSFDFAVVQAPLTTELDALVHELTRVARQGLITRRPPAL